MIFPDDVKLENRPCPMGCVAADIEALTGTDRLHGLPGEFIVVRCAACGLMRTNPRPTLETIGFYYPEDYGPHQSTISPTDSGGTTDAFWRLAAKKIIDTDGRKVPRLKPGRMLEIGCASGAFLESMRATGWDVEGIELSSKIAASTSGRGYVVRTGPLELVSEPTEAFDLIVAWQVLEHLHDPISALKKLHGWTKSDGRLALSVPDASAWEFKTFQANWYALDLPRHLFHFTPKTLDSALAKAGWRTERIFWQYNSNNLLQSLRYWLRDRGWTGAAAYLSDVVQGGRHRLFRSVLGLILGSLRASGRMTAWARRT